MGKEGRESNVPHRYYMRGNTTGQTQYLDIGKKYKLNAYIYKGRVTGEYIIISNLHELPPVEQVAATQTTLQVIILPSTNKGGLLSPTQQGPPYTKDSNALTDTHTHYYLNSR